jgi:nitroreductase
MVVVVSLLVLLLTIPPFYNWWINVCLFGSLKGILQSMTVSLSMPCAWHDWHHLLAIYKPIKWWWLTNQVEQKRALADAALHQEWIANAPVVLVFLADEERSASKYHDRGRYLYAVQDATIAAAYTQLALEAAGLASCWVGAFYEDEVADIVGASLNNNNSNGEEEQQVQGGILRPVILMPVGVAAEHPKRHRRRAIKTLCIMAMSIHHFHMRRQQKVELILLLSARPKEDE